MENQPTSNIAQDMPTNLVYVQAIPLFVPPGLEYLTTIDQIFVTQRVELFEMITSFETKNRYAIINRQGAFLFSAQEESDCCTRQCCGSNRPFDMEIRDPLGREIIHLDRPLACDSICFPCWLQSLIVSSPPGQVIGSIEQQWSIFPSFAVKDHAGQVVVRIEGPFCTFSWTCGDVVFKVLTADGTTQIGQISKQWTGILNEAFTDADNFGISFPIDLEVRVKALLIGACFLIDFMYFEGNGNNC